MIKRLRIAVEKARLLVSVGFIAGAICSLAPGTSAAFDVGSLTGGYGCLGHATIGDANGTLEGISELMRLNFSGTGTVKGTIVYTAVGEVCNVATTGTYIVGGGGLGSMSLTFNSVTTSADGDADDGPFCSSLNALAITQHTSLVVEAGGATLDIQASDDFNTSPSSTADVDVENPFVGNCRKQ